MRNTEQREKQKQLLPIQKQKMPSQEELDDFLVEILASAVRNMQKQTSKKN